MFQDTVEQVIHRRGHVIASRGDDKRILYPFDVSGPLPEDSFPRFRELFGRASFRKVVRRLTQARRAPVPTEELGEMAGRKVREYVQFLVSLGVAETTGGEVTLTRDLDNIGPTLEWYVHRLCRDELGGKAEWAVQLEGLAVGGDYDVLAWLAPTLAYVELKSAAPAQVDDGELRHFLQRSEELAPDMAVLLVDTSDDLKDLLDRLFGIMLPVLRGAGTGDYLSWFPDRPFIRLQEDYPGVSFGYRRIYVTNSEPSIIGQLRRCLRHYHSRVRDQPHRPRPLINFVTGEVRDAR